MNERIKKLFKPAIIIAAVTFAICYLIKKPQEFGDYTSYVGYAVTAVTIFFTFMKNGCGESFLGIVLRF